MLRDAEHQRSRVGQSWGADRLQIRLARMLNSILASTYPIADLALGANPQGEPTYSFHMALVLDNLPQEIRPALTPVLERVVAQLQPQGLWLFGSWARGSQSACSDIDLLIEGFEGVPMLQAYDQALEAIGDCQLPLQTLVAAPSVLASHGDSPFWRSVKAEAKPLLAGSVFP